MSLLGIHLTLMMGPTIAVPVSFSIAEALTSVEVTHNDSGPSGFQLTFQVGRSGPLDLLEFGLLKNPLFQPFTRVILLVRFAIVPQVLMDGIITQISLSPNDEPGASTLTVTGEDVSVMMDLEEDNRQFPAVPDYVAVTEIIKDYITYGLVPPLPPPNPQALIPYNPLEELPQKPANMTDRGYLQSLAKQYGFLFYISPGPAPLVNTVHWGPPERLSIPQSALSVNMGPATNIESINFRYDAMLPMQVTTSVVGKSESTVSEPSAVRNIIPLASSRAEARRRTFLVGNDPRRTEIDAQGMVDQSFDNVVTATGQLDALRYNGLLNPRGLVGLRGVGKTYDGLYYVKTVTHNIGKGKYTQNFSLSREGTGTTTPFVLP
jgi:hypothetical protein